MATRTIVVHDRCIVDGCGRTLHSILEGERGICGPCHLKRMPDDTKRALNKLIAAAFNGASEQQKDEAVADAMAKIKRDESGGKE